MSMIEEVSSGCTPLCFLPNGKLVCYKYGEVLICEKGLVVKKIALSCWFKEKYLSRCNYLNRLFRIGIRAAIAIDERTILVSFASRIIEIDLVLGIVSNGYGCDEGVRPLMFCNVEKISSIDDGIYFGGYLLNKSKKPVSVYKRIGMDKWEIVYTYPLGMINHVHTIVNDSYRDCIWIFTGDFGEASAIWKVTDNFRKIERVCFNNQRYRGCVAFSIPEGLLYATDSPFVDNKIYLLNPADCSVESVAPINGSCIYGCQWNDKYVFSTTVEADGRNETLFKLLFSKKRGAGIKDDFVHMICGNLEIGFRDIYKEKKDIMPFLFQFGAFKFPYGVNKTDTLYFQPIATVQNDLKLSRIVRS